MQAVRQIATPKVSGIAMWVGKKDPPNLLSLLLLPETRYGKIFLGPLKVDRVFNVGRREFEGTFYAANMRALEHLFGRNVFGKSISVISEKRIQRIATEPFDRGERIHYLLILNREESKLPIRIDPKDPKLINSNNSLLPFNMFPFDQEVAKQIFQKYEVREISPLFFEIAIFI